ncbi:MAG: pseudouridine synthase [Rubellimicrobium sp.]|nr:pseudouridine synthase [Rubellimicrobium sp.]
MTQDDSAPDSTPDAPDDFPGERIAKVLSRAGVASRRDAERMIAEGRVQVNGRIVTSPALNVGPKDRITVDDAVIPAPEPLRIWRYHKPAGLVTSARDEAGRATIFDEMPADLPKVMPVGRLDINSEGLLLLTNDGGVKRRLELPSTAWLRRYRVRVHGEPDDAALDALRAGVTVDGVEYQPMEVQFDRQQGANAWLTVGLREGRNREIRRVMEHLGLKVARLIRISYGPFQLGDLVPGAVEEVRARVVRDQLGLEAPEPEDRPARGTRPLLSAAERRAGRALVARKPVTGGRRPKVADAAPDAAGAPQAGRVAPKRGRAGPAAGRDAKPPRGEDRPRREAPRRGPPRDGDSRPARPPRRDGPGDGTPRRTSRSEAAPGDAHPPRSGPRADRPGGGGPRADHARKGPPRDGAPRGERSFGDRPRDERPREDGPRKGPPRSGPPRDGAPRGERSFGDRPRDDRPREGGPRPERRSGPRPDARSETRPDRPRRPAGEAGARPDRSPARPPRAGGAGGPRGDAPRSGPQRGPRSGPQGPGGPRKGPPRSGPPRKGPPRK